MFKQKQPVPINSNFIFFSFPFLSIIYRSCMQNSVLPCLFTLCFSATKSCFVKKKKKSLNQSHSRSEQRMHSFYLRNATMVNTGNKKSRELQRTTWATRLLKLTYRTWPLIEHYLFNQHLTVRPSFWNSKFTMLKTIYQN